MDRTSSNVRSLPLTVLLLVTLWSFSAYGESEDFELKFEDCGSPVLKTLKVVQHGPVYPGGHLKSTTTFKVLKDTKGGKVVTKVQRKLFGRYRTLFTSGGVFCEYIGRKAGCELKAGETVTYSMAPDIPSYAIRGTYRFNTVFTSDDGDFWACSNIVIKIVKKPTGYMHLVA